MSAARATRGPSQRPVSKCPSCERKLGNLPHADRGPSPAGRRARQRRCVWFRKRRSEGATVLWILPFPLIDYDDAVCMVRSLTQRECASGVVVNLASMASLPSGLLAGLLTLQKRVEKAGGKLVLCGATPTVRGVLAQTRLDTLFTVCARQTDAVRSCRDSALRKT